MEKPIDGFETSSEIGKRVIDQPELPSEGLATDSEVFTEVVEGQMQLKRGKVRHFEVFCDEQDRIGGTDKYPSPMSYMAMGTGF